MQTTFDLRYLYPRCKGLGDLARVVLGIMLNKDGIIAGSDWECRELSYSQKKYAAMDALVAIDVFKTFLLRFGWGWNNSKIFDYCELYEIFSRLDKTKYFNQDPPKNSTSSRKICESSNLENKTTAKAKEKKPYTTPLLKKTDYYEKCYIYDPNKKLLCSCDFKYD